MGSVAIAVAVSMTITITIITLAGCGREAPLSLGPVTLRQTSLSPDQDMAIAELRFQQRSFGRKAETFCQHAGMGELCRIDKPAEDESVWPDDCTLRRIHQHLEDAMLAIRPENRQ